MCAILKARIPDREDHRMLTSDSPTKQKLRVYLDNCCYNRPYDDQSRLKVSMEAQAKLEIQQQIRDGKLELTTSYILEAENAVNPFAAKRTDIQSFIDHYTKVFVSDHMDAKVRQKAAEIMNSGVKLMDACHVACAILSDCDFFLTTDKRLLKYHTDAIRLMNPAAFILEQEVEG